MKNIQGLLILSFILVRNGEVLSKKRICVIGAGRSGLAAIKVVADRIDNYDLTAFERNSDVGGLWIYRDDPEKDEHGLNAHSGIYKHLSTNIPRRYMIYPDYPDFNDKEYRLHVPHYVFLEYMRNYTDHFQLRKYIQFDTLVTKVIPIKGNGDWTTTTWRIELKNLNTGSENVKNCDAVMVCNGHFSKPYIPEIPGLKETFPGKILHSRNYRVPEVFTNKTVVVLGGGNSGVDIAIDLADYASKTYLSHRYSSIFSQKSLPRNVKVVRGVVAVDGGELILQDDSIITADVFIFSTGYELDFPFLDSRSGVMVKERRLTPLHDSFINAQHPSMAFIGIGGAFGQTYYSEAIYFLSVLKGERMLDRYNDYVNNFYRAQQKLKSM